AVLAHLAFGLLAARHRLVEVVEGGRAADGVQVAYGADGCFDVLACDEARRHLLEGPELRREVFQPLLPRKEKECASGNHRLVRQSVPPISSGVSLKTPHNRCCGMLQRAFTARLALPTPTGDSTDACVLNCSSSPRCSLQSWALVRVLPSPTSFSCRRKTSRRRFGPPPRLLSSRWQRPYTQPSSSTA